MAKTVELIINGETRRFDGALSVADLVGALGLEARKIAIELNLEIVPKSQFKAASLKDGDRLEIVHFVGGG